MTRYKLISTVAFLAVLAMSQVRLLAEPSAAPPVYAQRGWSTVALGGILPSAKQLNDRKFDFRWQATMSVFPGPPWRPWEYGHSRFGTFSVMKVVERATRNRLTGEQSTPRTSWAQTVPEFDPCRFLEGGQKRVDIDVIEFVTCACPFRVHQYLVGLTK